MKGYTITDVGKVRSENQDRVSFIQGTGPAFAVLALCDGMGGANAGSMASDIAINTFTSQIAEHLSDKKEKVIDLKLLAEGAVFKANQRVYKRGSTDITCAGMGTTLVGAIVSGRKCCIANVGDSRAYLISNGEITQITRDHSFVEELIDKGRITREQAQSHPRKNIITRAIGVEKSVECDVFLPVFRKNDLLLLCSDGLSNTVTDEEMLEIVKNKVKLNDIGKELLDLALSRGAPDNVTVGLLRK